MRMGQFSRTGMTFGQSLSVVKPRDNNPGSVVPSELFDPALELTEEQRLELVERIEDLFDVYRGERDFFG